MEELYDVIIVGGSANGSQVARVAALEGMKTLVIEEHPTTGFPEHCSGLFSYTGLIALDALPPDDIVFNYDIYGSRLIAPNGKTLTVRKRERHAMVTNRAMFDQFLLEKAVSEGAELLQPYRATIATRKNGLVEVVATNRKQEEVTLQAKILVSAEGVRGKIAEQMGLKGPRHDSLIYAAQYFVKDMVGIDKELVEVYQTHEFAPDFFGWIIPMSETEAKVGLGTSLTGAAKQLDRMIEHHPVMRERMQGAEIYRKIAGRIPVMGPVKKTYSDQFLLVGDVAGQTKPTTGGGVILGGIAGMIAGKVASDAIRKGKTDAKSLKVYEKRWKKEMARNLWLQRKVRNYMNLLSDAEMNRFFDKLDDRGLLDKIETHGDVDNQGKLAMKLLGTLSLYPFYLKTSYKLLRAIASK